MWLELLQGPGQRAPRHFTRSRLFRVRADGGQWACQLANWPFRGAVQQGRLWLDLPQARWVKNGVRVTGAAALDPLDVVLFDDGLAFRVHDQPQPQVAAALDWAGLEGTGAVVMADAFLERGDAFGELLAHPTDARRAQWLSLLLWPAAFGSLHATWEGAGLFALELHARGDISSSAFATWLTRLPRRLHMARIGAPLQMLIVRAAHFQGWMWREALEGFGNGLEDVTLERLESIELPRPVQQLASPLVFQRLRDRLPAWRP